MKKAKTKNRLSCRFKSYLLVGGAAFAVEYVAFAIFSSLEFGLLFSQSISFTAGFIISFTGNKKITFNSKESNYTLSNYTQLWRYALLAVMNLLLSNALIHLLVEGFGFSALIAKIVVMISVVCWNYVVFNRFIFRTN